MRKKKIKGTNNLGYPLRFKTMKLKKDVAALADDDNRTMNNYINQVLEEKVEITQNNP